MDGDIVVCVIRPFAQNRKDVHFAGHNEGSRNWDRIVSLIDACKLNHVESYACLRAILEIPQQVTPRPGYRRILAMGFPRINVTGRSETAYGVPARFEDSTCA